MNMQSSSIRSLFLEGPAGRLEALLNTHMMRISHEVTVVADASKFGRRSLSVIGGINSVRRIITDDRARPETLEAIRSKGVEVIVA